MREAEWFVKSDGGWKCMLCPRGCTFREGAGGRGLCRVRGVKDGIPYLPGYAECVSLSIDPIEKKPLYHFLPGTVILSTGPPGCNLTCDFCQNWTISQSDDVPTRHVPPQDLAEMAMSRGSRGIAFTYTEPAIWFEYIADVAPLVRDLGGAVVMVSNGEVTHEPLESYIRFTDAWNVDLKSWSPEFYGKHCSGSLDAVLDTLKTLAASRCHLEVTFLIIPGENDDPEEWREMAAWLSGNCGRDTVLHISRYFPRYRLRREPTPVETLVSAMKIFSENLDHVYLGNVSAGYSDTVCPSCGAVCVDRNGWAVDTSGLRGGACASCGQELDIVHEL
ncbi:MAG: AmmeMemoRadiSam system radical SAM enzyme [Candidatus Fermentibacteraceae bacterium]|nr:AmmeMemoRadiSam system radical SAM enzyme [Candidatus Fermentibacteraceae bacterium]